MTETRIFSGIQPSGDAHIGNYSGGFRQYAGHAGARRGVFLHRRPARDHAAARPGRAARRHAGHHGLLFATGLDPERSTVFVQSHVTAHAEAAWLLSSVTSYGQLGRMTQFKEKSAEEEFVSAALFTYPVLMAGDILLYQTDIVPIGDDQRQHLELSRDIAQRFNSRYGETFVVPEGVFPETGARVMNLQEPDVKMSKSRGAESGTILMLDPPETVQKKVKTAVTDSGHRGAVRPGGEAGHLEPDRAHDRRDGPVDPGGRGALRRLRLRDGSRATLPTRSSSCSTPIQARYRELRSDRTELQRLLAVGAEKARASSAPTLALMYERLGFAR